MFFKKIVTVSVVAAIALAAAACSDSAEDACEHINEKCASQEGFTKADCSKSNDEYDKLSDSDKEKADKIKDCIMDADACTAIIACATSGG